MKNLNSVIIGDVVICINRAGSSTLTHSKKYLVWGVNSNDGKLLIKSQNYYGENCKCWMKASRFKAV